MNTNQPSTTIYLGLFILLFLTLGLAGCALIQPIPGELLPTEVSNIDVQEPSGEDPTVTTNPGTEPAPSPGTLTYTNERFGFQFDYPNTWALEEGEHAIILTKGTNRLGINYGWLGEQSGDNFGRTGVGAGDFISAEKIRFMDQVILVELLTFDGKVKALFFGGTSLVETGNLVFMIVLEDLETDYLQVDLSEEIMIEANTILETFKPIDKVDDPIQGTSATQQGLHAILEIPEHLPLGEKINLKFTLKNNSDTPLYILNWYTPLEGIGGEIFRVTYNGQPIPYKGILAYRAPPTKDVYVLLNPGESVSADVDLAPSYEFDQAGVYKIEFISPRISHIAHTEAEMASTMEELGPIEIPSNTVSFELDDIP